MKLNSMRFAIFLKKALERPDRIGDMINREMNECFDTMPNIIPLPVNVPVDVPVVQMRSKDGIFNLNIGRNRIDFIIAINNKIRQTPNDIFTTYRNIIENYYNAIVKNEENIEKMQIVRTGIVFTLFDVIEENSKSIYDKYLKIAYDSNCKDVSLRFNKQEKFGNIIVNQVQTIEALNLHLNNNGTFENKAGIRVLFDINNVPQATMLDIEKLLRILNIASMFLNPDKVKEII